MATDRLYDIVTRSPEETLAFGRSLAGLLRPPCVVLLQGELGSGKTTLTKGIVAGLGAAEEDEVTSPTFTLVREYRNPAVAADTGQVVRVYHVDLYRIDGRRGLESLGLDEFFNPSSTVIIEWGDKFPDSLPAPVFRIRLAALPESSFHRSIVLEREK